MRRAARLICITLALALSLALALGGCAVLPETEEPEGPVTTLWLYRGQPAAEALEQLAADYNATQPESPLVLRVFASEQAMADAMNEARPDLLLCPGERGFALYAQGKLREAAPAVALSGAFSALDDSVGRAFFPLGAETPLLAVNAAAYLASPVTSGAGDAALKAPESLFSLAAAHGRSTGQPFFAASSWFTLFETALRQRGAAFDGSFEGLRDDADAAALYNALAEAAFARGVYTGSEPAAELVRRGYVVCALVASRELARDAEGLVCYAAPAAGEPGAEVLAPARVWGLAVSAGDESALPGLEAFLSWLLQPERAGALALDEGLLPAVPLDEAGAEPGSLEEALRATLESCTLYAAPADEGGFDERLRAALALFD